MVRQSGACRKRSGHLLRENLMVSMQFEHDLKESIRTIPDYPKPGIMFRDITTLLGNARAFRRAVDELVQPWAGHEDRQGRRHRGARLHPRRRGGASGLGRLRADPQEGQAAAQAGLDRLFAGIRPRRDGDARGRGGEGRPRDPGRRPDRDRRHRRRRGQAAAPDRRARCSPPASSSTCPTSAAPTSCASSTCRCARWSRSRGISACPGARASRARATAAPPDRATRAAFRAAAAVRARGTRGRCAWSRRAARRRARAGRLRAVGHGSRQRSAPTCPLAP